MNSYMIVSITDSGLGMRLRVDRRIVAATPDAAAEEFVKWVDRQGDVVSELMVLSDCAAVLLDPVRAQLVRPTPRSQSVEGQSRGY